MRRNSDRRLVEFFPKDVPFADAFKSLFESASDAIYILDMHGNFVAINRQAEKLTGFKREDWIGKSFRKIIVAKSLPKAIKGFMNVIRGKPIRLELELKTAFKKPVLVEVTSKPLIIKGKVVGTLGIARDITERKKVEEALRRSEEKFRNIFEGASDCMIYLDRSGRILNVNRKAVEVFGGSKNEILGKHFTKTGVVSPRDIPRLITVVARGLAGKKGTLDISVKNKKGQEIHLECSNSLMKADNKFIGLLVIARDVTERKKVEKAILESQQKFERLFSGNPEAAAYVNSDYHILDVNPRFSELFGYSLDEVKGKSVDDVVVPEDKMEEAEMLDKKAKEGYVYYDTFRKRKDGSLVSVSVSAAPITVEGQLVGYVALYKDITERILMEKKLEEYSHNLEELVEQRTRQLKEVQKQLLKAERLAAIGELAAMIGHDLRNPLSGIAGATYYLKTKLDSKMDNKTSEMLVLIENAIEYSNKIIGDLLDYSREIRLEPAETTPKSITKVALTLVKVPKNIRISDLTKNKPKIKVDVDKTKRVFVNIIRNAIDAMPEGGKLTIKSTKTNSNLQISFIDTGIGMPKNIFEKIWTPLFTTKAKGIGLGLSICKRIIEAHGGKISVESKVSKGTTFTVTIPIETKLEGGEKVWVNVPESLLSTTTKA